MSFLRRFSNPQFMQQSTQIVSRADLEAEHDVPHEEVENDDQDIVQALESMLKRSLGDFQTSQVEHAGDERQKKRRKKNKTGDTQEIIANTKEEVKDAGEEGVEFRLLSKATKVVSLKPKPVPQITVVEPSWEDDEREAALRAERARVAAVDVAWIFEESRKPYYLPANADRKVIVVALEQPLPPTDMLVLEVPRAIPSVTMPPSVPLNAPATEQPSPHDFPPEKICCPVVSGTIPQVEPSSSRRRRMPRHKKKSIEPRPPPSFWRPPREWGGKSLGYGMGYEGSRPVPTGSVRQWRYRRDTMKKGVLVA